MICIDGALYEDQFIRTAVEAVIKAGIPLDSPSHTADRPVYTACETPRGILLAYPVYEQGEYPGIAIDLEEKASGDVVGLVTTEVNIPEGITILTYVFTDMSQDEYTHVMEHRNGE